MNCHNHTNRIPAALLALVLVTLACGFKPPVTHIKTGAIQGVEIQIPLQEEQTTDVELNLEFVAGDLKLAPGASGYLASGKATYNAVDFEPIVESTGSSYTLRQGEQDIEGIPVAQEDLINKWEMPRFGLAS